MFSGVAKACARTSLTELHCNTLRFELPTAMMRPPAEAPISPTTTSIASDDRTKWTRKRPSSDIRTDDDELHKTSTSVFVKHQCSLRFDRARLASLPGRLHSPCSGESYFNLNRTADQSMQDECIRSAHTLS